MRPAAYGSVPASLFMLFTPEILEPLVETWVEEALDWLVRAGKMTIQTVKVTATFNPELLHIKIDYIVREENIRDTYETEIRSFSPVNEDAVRKS
jgi:hypothetical protein